MSKTFCNFITVSSSSAEVCTKPYGNILPSISSFTNFISGTFTLIIFFDFISTDNFSLGKDTALSKNNGLIVALARRKDLKDSESSFSTSTRSFLFSLMRLMNCLINSSCLSFKSLCPLFAVTSLSFNSERAILVGFTFSFAIIIPPSLYHSNTYLCIQFLFSLILYEELLLKVSNLDLKFLLYFYLFHNLGLHTLYQNFLQT